MKKHANYYRILHVQSDAPVEVIKTSYRTLLKKLKNHPDLGGSHVYAALLNEACAVLSDAKRREQYDQKLARDSVREKGTQASSQRKGKPHHASTSQTLCAFCKAPYSDSPQLEPEPRCSQCASPLRCAMMEDLESGCQRAVERINKEGAVVYYTHWPSKGQAGRISDLSPMGMRFLANDALTQNQVIKIDSPLVQATARAAYCQVEEQEPGFRYAIGVQFITVAFKKSRGTFISKSA